MMRRHPIVGRIRTSPTPLKRLALGVMGATLLLVLVTTAGDASGPSFSKVGVDPVDGAVHYGLAGDGRLWRSDDSGTAWMPLQLTGIRDFVVRFGGSEGAAAAFGCACGGYAAATATSTLDALAGDTLQRSYDRGHSWFAVRTSGLRPADAAALTIDPSQHDDMRVTLHDGEQVRSLDGGHTWRPMR